MERDRPEKLGAAPSTTSAKAVRSLRFAALCLVANAALASVPSDRATLSLTDLNLRPQTLDQYRGRVVILNFWATWCVPCRDEMPLLVDVQERYESEGVVVVGASADDKSTQEQIQPFVEEVNITFPIWTGATVADMERLGLGTALPPTAVIDRDGTIAFRLIGVLHREALEQRIDYLLSGGDGIEAPERLVDTLSEADRDHHGHDHADEEEHTHGGVGVEGASMVPS